MLKKKNLLYFGAIFCISFLIVFGLGLFPNAYAETAGGIAEASSNSTFADSSVYTFVKTSETECSVRLADKSIKKAIIPEKAVISGQTYTVTSIVGNGFSSATNLEKVRLPKSIKSIGNAAFANCQKLKSITLNSVQSIGTNAFNLCTSLSYLIIPESVTTVAPTVLRSCNTQVYIRTSESETQGGTWASNWNGANTNQNVEFDSTFTPSIEYVEVPNSTTRSTSSLSNEIVGYYVDDYQPFMEERQDSVYVYIPSIFEGAPVLGIVDGAFTYNTIDYLTIGYAENPIHIDSYAFNGLIGTSITINRDIDINVVDWQGNDTLAEYLFADSMVSTIILPNTIESIGAYMFNGCASLQDIGFIQPTLMANKEEEENIVNNFISTQIIELPSSVIKIGAEAFSSIPNISEISIPQTVLSVGEAAFVGWTSPQMISIAYEKESDLPWNETTLQGWSPNWKSGCSWDVIQFSGEFRIEYTLNGGEHQGNPEAYTSREEIILKDATRTGYTFAGWYMDSSFNSERIYTIAKGASGDLHLFAKWEANTYDIIYHANKPYGASNSVTGLMLDSTFYYDINSQLSPNSYSLNGWTFTGWNTKADGSGTTYENEQAIYNLTANKNVIISLYAQWSNNDYKIVYHNNKPNYASGFMTGTTQDSTHLYDISNVLNTNNFGLIGWTFNHWNTQSDGNGTSYDDGQSVINLIASDNGVVTLFAQWTPNQYIINYASNKPINASQPLQGTTLNSTHQYDSEGSITSNGFSLLGWSFNGWNTQANGNGTNFIDSANIQNLASTNNAMITLFAQWSPITFYVEYKNNKPSEASGVISGSMIDSIHTYDSTSKLTLIGYTLPGWTFKNWNTKLDGTGISYADNESILNATTINSTKITLYAHWDKKTYKINYDGNKPNNASGSLSGQMDETRAIYEHPIVLVANSYNLEGWIFSGWNTKADGSGIVYGNTQIVKNITTADAITLFAQWIPDKYDVIYISNKPSSSSQPITGNMSNSELDYDTASALSDVGYAMKGYEFVGWATTANGSVVYDNLQSITLGPIQGPSITLYAIWEVITYNIWGTNSDTGETSIYRTYTVEQEVRFEDRTSFGYDWEYSLHYIPKGTIGDVNMNYTHRPIIYYLIIEFYGTGSTLLKEPVRYAVKYDERKTITAPNFNGYNFMHFAHLKNPIFLPPLLPGQQHKPEDLMDIYPNQTTTFSNLTSIKGEEYVIRAVYEKQPTIEPAPPSCIAAGSLITLADGSQKAVELLTGNEHLLVWNLKTGSFDTAPILFIDSDPQRVYEVINLTFSDGTTIKVISEHAFWDIDLNRYVYLRNDAAQYIGHWFNKQSTDANGNMTWTAVQLTNVVVASETTTAWSPVTAEHLCYYVNGMLSMPGGTTGLINIFDVNSETMQYDQVAMQADIEEYGLFAYEEFAELVPVSVEIFDAFDAQYFKVAIGKGLIDIEGILVLVETYSEFFTAI